MSKPMSPMELQKLKEVTEAYTRDEMIYMIQFMPLDIIWNEAERRLKEAMEYKEAMSDVIKKFSGDTK